MHNPTRNPSQQLIVVAVTGPARSGKDTAAGVLVNQFGFHRMALADGIRSAFSDLSGPTWELHKELSDETVNVRRVLQLLGTEAREEVGCPRLWVDLLLTKLRYAHITHPVPRSRFVIPDLRYPYEREWIEEKVIGSWGGRFECWRATRVDLVPIAESAHSSERLIDSIPFERELMNNGSLSDYALVVSHAAQSAIEGIGDFA